MVVAGKRWFAALLVLVGLALPACIYAQSILNIPRVVWTTDLFTGISIANPTPAESSVTFTAYQPDGTPLTGVTNPVTLTIPPAGQISKNFREIFESDTAFNGWVQVTSNAAGLTGFFLNSNTALTDFAASGAADPGAEFILPFA